jgi:hypothetical protein
MRYSRGKASLLYLLRRCSHLRTSSSPSSRLHLSPWCRSSGREGSSCMTTHLQRSKCQPRTRLDRLLLCLNICIQLGRVCNLVMSLLIKRHEAQALVQRYQQRKACKLRRPMHSNVLEGTLDNLLWPDHQPLHCRFLLGIL